MKKIITIIFALICMMMLAIGISAEQTEANFEYLDSTQSIVIGVEWDVETPSVVFVSPDGEEFNPFAESENTTTVMGDKQLFYTIIDARAGQWRVRYDKKSNTVLEMTLYDYNEGLRIDSFTKSEVENDRLPVKFTVSGEEGRWYEYKISAVISRGGAEKQLYSGSSITGREVDLDLRLNNLSTYDSYMLKLYVWYDADGTDIFDLCYSEKFSYTNTSVDNREENFKLTVLPEDCLVEIEWENRDWNVDGVLIALFENNGSEPVTFDTYDYDDKKVQLSYSPSSTRIDVEYTLNYNGVNGTPTRKGADLQNIGVTLPEGDAFNTLSFPVEYKGFTKQSVELKINDTTQELIFDGNGKITVTLADDWNDFNIVYEDANGINWLIERRIFIDRTAPVLTMSQSYDRMSVDEGEITISGTVYDCSKLLINGEEVEYGEGGMFSKVVSLKDGENALNVSASDALGNESLYSAKIYKGEAAADYIKNEQKNESAGGWLNKLTDDGNYYVLIITSVMCLLVIGYALIFWRKGKKG